MLIGLDNSILDYISVDVERIELGIIFFLLAEGEDFLTYKMHLGITKES